MRLTPSHACSCQSFVDKSAGGKGVLGAVSSKMATQAQRRALTMFGRSENVQPTTSLSSQVRDKSDKDAYVYGGRGWHEGCSFAGIALYRHFGHVVFTCIVFVFALSLRCSCR